MTQATEMLETYPLDLGHVDQQALADCIDACFDCAQACTACADACLSEDTVAELVKCIRTNLDCADICATTGRVLSRHTGYDANTTRVMLQACIQACRSCGEECQAHASEHEHCQVCAEACRRCEQACRDLMAALG
ncbi:four-helix bundle copper-binding protein [Solwaraspora sp. WMMD792]|mgnify:CR=1 FL=1|uniref:four-helix bundle copper-binding protein n=1 Tax=unclassified Solwaraspora TaxID=2627926 RepID=UPI0024170779|nr:four-helix bundle copper-binding protein [Solwaraspora sp. WMMD792]MDG4773562.1 four-helix bundle copper-binding protein [Solwaraspora sp. WMMD792]